jgi:HEAT repeat protein
VILGALRNPDAGVRWQAAQVIGKARWSNSPPVNALIDTLHDGNVVVAASAVRALMRLNATNAGPAVFAELKLRLEHPASEEELQSQQQAIALPNSDARMGSGFLMFSLNVLDPDNVLMHLRFGNPHAPSGRSVRHPAPGGSRPFRPLDPTPPVPGGGDFFAQNQFDSIDTWIQSLGALQCRDAEDDLLQWLSSDRKPAVFSALEKLGSPRLVEQMLVQAKDTHADSEDRADALVKLCRLNATNQIRAIAYLLTETTVIPISSSKEWRICDRAADTIAGLLGWKQRLRMFASVEERDAFVDRVKKSLSSTGDSAVAH